MINVRVNLRKGKEQPKKDPRTAQYETCEKAYWEYVKKNPKNSRKGNM